MKINRKRIICLSNQNGWTQNELARRMGLPRGTLSNVLSGRRGAGRKILSGFLRIFPEEQLDNLIIK